MTSLTVQPRLRSFTGLVKPCISGPMAPPPDDCCTACPQHAGCLKHRHTEMCQQCVLSRSIDFVYPEQTALVCLGTQNMACRSATWEHGMQIDSVSFQSSIRLN